MTDKEKRERIRIYILYWQYPGGPLRDILKDKCPEKKFEINKYSSIFAFQEQDKISSLSEGDVLIVHLGQGCEKDNPETLADFISEIRLKWPFCRIGIESGAYLYSVDGRIKRARTEEVLRDNLPDFYFYDRLYEIEPFLIKMFLKGSLSNEEIVWRNEGNVLTSSVEFGPGGRIERK